MVHAVIQGINEDFTLYMMFMGNNLSAGHNPVETSKAATDSAGWITKKSAWRPPKGSNLSSGGSAWQFLGKISLFSEGPPAVSGEFILRRDNGALTGCAQGPRRGMQKSAITSPAGYCCRAAWRDRARRLPEHHRRWFRLLQKP